jgi:hypothetical protein
MRHPNTPTYLNIATIAIILLIITANKVIITIIITPMNSYFNAVWSGSEDPLWPNVVLLGLSVLAALAVGFAIFVEHPKVSSASFQTFAFWCLVFGVPIEPACTILLFVVDERISIAQQAELEITTKSARIARNIAADATDRATIAIERAAEIEKEAAQDRKDAALTEERLLTERRVTANERWRLERLERIVLPRPSIDFNLINNLAEAFRSGGFHKINVAYTNLPEPSGHGLLFVAALSQAGLLGSVTPLPKNSTAPSLIVVAIDSEGDRIADLLFQKFGLGNGWRSALPLPSSQFAGVPTDRNCIVVGSKGDTDLSTTRGQPGEGLDEHGGAVPAPPQ